MEILIGLILGIVWFVKYNRGNPYEKGDWDIIAKELIDKDQDDN